MSTQSPDMLDGPSFFYRPSPTEAEMEVFREECRLEEIQFRQRCDKARQIRERLVLPPEALLPVVELETDLIEKLLTLRPWQAGRGVRKP